jgi:Ni/Fe-hydrogenase 1 B-type cytochrome subunit
MATVERADTSRELAPAGTRLERVGEPQAQVYVWDLPVRLTHWINVFAILVLSITGYYIANPFVSAHNSTVPIFQYLMSTVRFVHFVTAFIFTASVLFRVYWSFVGSKYARWPQFLPVNSGRRRALGKMLGYYTFLRKAPPAQVGHNPLAGITYVGLYVLFALQIATGFALYSLPFHDGIWKTLFGWMVVVFGAQPLRLIHDIIMYLIIAFTIHHVYSAVLIDIEERSGLVSSIITGRKSLTREHLAAAAELEQRPVWRRWAPIRRKARPNDDA